MIKPPILYSFRRCPYAIRARLAIRACRIRVELREVILADKPKELLACSSKGTVPVLVLSDGEVIDESRDIMLWALKQSDPQDWLSKDAETKHESIHLIEANDCDFKVHLDHYKYADRFPEQTIDVYRRQGETFLQQLEQKLANNKYLVADRITLADMAIFPFIRQFCQVDKTWFYQTEYKQLQAWLDALLADNLFAEVMKKYAQWQSGDNRQMF